MSVTLSSLASTLLPLRQVDESEVEHEQEYKIISTLLTAPITRLFGVGVLLLNV